MAGSQIVRASNMFKKILTINKIGSKSHKQTRDNNTIASDAIKNEYKYGTLGLILGLISILGGILLVFNGAVGSTSWSASILGFKSEINDAIPGVVLFIVGIFITLITRPKVKIGDIT